MITRTREQFSHQCEDKGVPAGISGVLIKVIQGDKAATREELGSIIEKKTDFRFNKQLISWLSGILLQTGHK